MTESFATVPFAEALLAAARRAPARECMIIDDERETYTQVVGGARRVASSLLAAGVRRSERVGILMTNSLDFVHCLFGASLIGAVPVLYNARFKARELAHVTADAGVKVLLTSGSLDEHACFVDLLHRSLPGLAQTGRSHAAPGLEQAVFLGAGERAGFTSRTDFFEAGTVVAPASIDEHHHRTAITDLAALFYTSGTTAMPKGCPLDHVVLQHAGVVGGVDRLGLRDGDALWGPLPMFHTGFTQPLSGILHVAGTFVTTAHFAPQAALRQIERERPRVMFPAFPTITMQLLDHPRYHPDAFASVEVMVNVAPPDVLQGMQDRMPHTTQITVFGMTETGGSVAMGCGDEPASIRSGWSGLPLPGDEVQIRGADSGVRLGVGEPGEIVVRGRGVFDGYLADGDPPNRSLDADGWFRTGDLGCLDHAGRVRFLGRLKDMLKVGGENVASVEIEGFLATHPAVALAQVVAVPDDKYDEVPGAFIERARGAAVTEQELIDYCQGEIASFKIPRHVRFVDAWPMGATKILKYKLRAQLLDELGIESDE